MHYQQGKDGKSFHCAQSPPEQQTPNKHSTPLNQKMNESFHTPQKLPQEQFYSNPLGSIERKVVADAAFSCGKKIMGTGRDIVDEKIKKSGILSAIRHYFAVDHTYVANKLAIILFPFHHRDWSRQYTNSVPEKPRFDVNSPDLYIPLMGYITYLFVAGLVLGIQNRFDIEILAKLVSQTIVSLLLEIGIQLLALYLIRFPNNLASIELIALSGYKFVGLIVSILLGVAFNKTVYYAALIYFSSASAFLMVRSLRLQILIYYYNSHDVSADGSGGGFSFSDSHHSSSDLMEKRQLYFLALVALCQPVFMWWFSFNFVAN